MGDAKSDSLGNLAKFLAVAQEVSITRAAAKLGVSQSALSHSVRRLEDWCEPFDGYYLCYPSCRQPTVAFRLLLDVLHIRG